VSNLTDVDGYLAVITELSNELDALTTRFDARLDPSTARVIALVRADLTDLAASAQSAR
jgi:hypothetical protein